MSALSGTVQKECTPEFRKIIDSLLDEVRASDSFAISIRSLSNNLKIKEQKEDKILSPLNLKEPSSITELLWDGIDRLRAINRSNEEVLSDLRELI